MLRQVLLTGAYRYTEKQFHLIEELGWKITYVENELERLDISVEPFEAVVCNGLFLHNDIADFKNLRMVQATSAGLERLPIRYMEKHHILYYNARGVYSIPMAEWAVMCILEIYKKAPAFFLKQQKKCWEKERSLLELTDRKVCIVGYGSVGREISKRLAAFGTKITAVNRTRIEDNIIHKWVPLSCIDEVLPEMDIVILCIALTEETKELLNADRLGIMKQESTLVNVSRGQVLDEKALIQQLKDGKFRGVALDVFEEEPLPQENALWEIPRVIISPHNSFLGDKVKERMFGMIYKNLKNMKA